MRVLWVTMVASAGSRPARVPALTKYEVLEELGHGGMATVYRAHDKRLGRDVAIKVLHPHLRESREIAHRFEAEAKAVAKLRHRNIVEVFDVSSADEDEQYLVVEFVRGQTLRKLLQKTGALPPEVAAALALELLGALAHAHSAGVVHRDVKPENVLLEHRSVDSPPTTSSPTPTPLPTTSTGGVATSLSPPSAATSRRTPVDSNRGERIAVKLTDFGIAKLLDAQGVTSTGQVLGSPAHMAPEQIEGGDVDGRADVFGMGVLLYECMVGHLPFEGNNPAQVLRRVLDGIYPSAERERPSVGKIYSQILDRALARQAEDRYDNAEQMREALSTELLRLGVAAPRTELEAYFDDPEGWSAEHEKRLIGKLCTLGGDARKRGDAVAAAADYNRALAYAPNDPQLLRIVASMHRAEARMRMARRATPLVFGAIALGVGAFFVAKALKGSPAVLALPGPSSASSTTVVSAPSAVPSAKPALTSPAPSEHPALALGAVKPPLASTLDAGIAKKRSVTFASLQPQYGVVMNVDGVRGPDPGPGFTFMLPDEKPHALSFTCQDRDGNELCVPKTIPVPAGDTEQTLDVQLTILPAKLVVEGDPGKSYGIEEVPNITLASGVAAEIPMRAGQAAQTVTIYDRSDPDKRKKEALRAGRQHVVSFKNP
ncbi:MAG: eukaryotic-like serine/threonine-protein kinase [Myxococcales bacterium]|nr:eukaryotic-like serine/threonine-protein kinase [Myxococcales bacterium]